MFRRPPPADRSILPGPGLLGIYGVISYTVSQRTREMGIRAALGARAREILGLVLGRSLKLAALGIAVELAGAAAVGRSLEGFVEGVSATDPLWLAAVAALLAAVALGSSYAPARRAARVHPMEALRYE